MRINIVIVSFLFLICYLTASCSKITTEQTAINRALKQAGENRPELEQVLSHYHGVDSLADHERAARFLIANMPDHKTVVYEGMFSDIESIERSYPEMGNAVKSVVSAMLQGFHEEKETLADVSHIKADWLIEHIDNPDAQIRTIAVAIDGGLYGAEDYEITYGTYSAN